MASGAYRLEQLVSARKLLVDQHGEDAPIFAGMQADRCLKAGDLDGKATWMRVIRAIEELLDQQPPGSDGRRA